MREILVAKTKKDAERALARFRKRNAGAREREEKEKRDREARVADGLRSDYLRRTGRREMKP
jgi:hypothetical protein